MHAWTEFIATVQAYLKLFLNSNPQRDVVWFLFASIQSHSYFVVSVLACLSVTVEVHQLFLCLYCVVAKKVMMAHE